MTTGSPVNYDESGARLLYGADQLVPSLDVGTGDGASYISFDSTNISSFLTNSNAKVINSIAALRNTSKTKYTKVFVTGYYAAGDGGGGMYWYDNSDTTSTDNGGTIIVGADNGRWKLIHDNKITAKQFGAKFDGSTDDTVSIKALASYVGGSPTTPGLTAVLPKGTAIVSSGIDFNYCIVIGDGGGYWSNATTTIKKTNADAGSNYVILLNNSQIKGVAVTCPSAQSYTQVDYVIDAYSVTNGFVVGPASTVEDCKADNFKVGFSATGSVCSVRLSKASCCGKGIYLSGTDSFISDNYINLCFLYGIHIESPLFRVSTNRVEWCAHDGIGVTYGNGTITSNLLDRNGGPGVSLVGANCYGTNVSGNSFNRNGGGGDGKYGRWAFSTPAGGAASGYWDATVSGGKYSSHILIENANNISISGNSFFNYGDDTGQGSVSPRFNYALVSANSISIGSNADAHGYVTDYGYYSGTGALPSGSGYILFKSGTNYIGDLLYSGSSIEVNKSIGGEFIPTTYGVEYPGRVVSTGSTIVSPGFLGYGYGSTYPFMAARIAAGDGTAYCGYQGTGTSLKPYPSFNIRFSGYFQSGDGTVAPTDTFGPFGNSTLLLCKNVGFSPDNSVSCGTAAYRASVVYAATGTINTSDEREKQQIDILSDKETRVAIKCKKLIKKFKFNDSVKEKGVCARIHIGAIAQEIKQAFESEGLDAFAYSILCYDQWDDQVDCNGEVIKYSGNRYGLRYEELLCFIIAGL